MNEELPYIELNLAGQEFRATPLNTQLFRFAGKTMLESGIEVDNSIFDHVFLHTHGSDGEIQKGTYLFQKEIVDQLEEYMLAGGFPARLNQREVPECDRNAYQTYIGQIASYEAENGEDFIPDWMTDGEK